MAHRPQHVELTGGCIVVNFRFHLVSLTAVFFALALGVTVGATLLERTTVDTLESQVSRVEERLDETDALNERLQSELALGDRFAEELGDQLVQGHLEGVPVVLIGVVGVDRAPFDELRGTLTAAGADLKAVVLFQRKLALESETDAQELADVLETTATRPGLLRRQLFSALSTSWSSDTAHALLEQLRDTGFIEYEASPARDEQPGEELAAEPGQPGEEVGVDDPATERRFVVFSGAGVEVPNEELAIPLTEELARDGRRLILAAEPGTVDDEGDFNAPFVAEVRATDSVAGLVTTVDNVGTFAGRTATVLALADLATGRLGHYGRGEAAEALVPPSRTD